MLAGIARSV